MADNVVPDTSSSTAHKLATAKQMKETADQAFKENKLQEAMMSYHQSIMYLRGLDKNALQSIGITSRKVEASDPKDGTKVKELTEVDDILEKIYANMSACHIKNQNWQRAVETADKALEKNESNYKAMFRKGKALGEQGFFEKARKVLETVKTKNPSDALIVDQEIARLQAIDNERERVHKKKMKGFLNKAEKKGEALFNETTQPSGSNATDSTAVQPSFIEEVVEEEVV